MVDNASIPTDIDRELLHHFLAGRDAACPRCEYNLRDLEGDRCPECGDRLVLRVNAVEPRLGALICGLVGLASGTGLNGLLIIYAMFTMSGHGGMERDFLTVNGIGFCIEGAALVAWLKAWRSIRRLPSNAQWRWATGCWLLTAANLTYFTLTIK